MLFDVVEEGSKDSDISCRLILAPERKLFVKSISRHLFKRIMKTIHDSEHWRFREYADDFDGPNWLPSSNESYD